MHMYITYVCIYIYIYVIHICVLDVPAKRMRHDEAQRSEYLDARIMILTSALLLAQESCKMALDQAHFCLIQIRVTRQEVLLALPSLPPILPSHHLQYVSKGHCLTPIAAPNACGASRRTPARVRPAHP